MVGFWYASQEHKMGGDDSLELSYPLSVAECPKFGCEALEPIPHSSIQNALDVID